MTNYRQNQKQYYISLRGDTVGIISSIYNSGYNIKRLFLGEQELKLAYLGEQIVFNEVIDDLNYVLYEFYKGKAISNTIEAPVKRAILKGNTLVNLLNKLTVNGEVGQTTNWYTTTYTTGTVKSGTYILLYHVKETSGTMSRNTPGIRLADGTYLYHGYEDFNTTTGIKKWIFTANEDLSEFGYWLTYNTGKVVVEDFILLEYQEGMENWDIPYFTGMQSVKMPVLTTTGKNLFDGEIEEGIIDTNTGEPQTYDGRSRSKNFIRVPKNTDLYIKVENGGSTSWTTIYGYDENKKYLGCIVNSAGANKTFNTGDASYIKWKNNAPMDTLVNIQIEQGSTATSYEPFKSNILTVNEEVELRDIKDTKYFNGGLIGQQFTDVLDCTNGELKIQTNKITMDGSKQPILSSSKENVSIFKYKPNDLLIERSFDGGDIFNCDKLNFVSSLWEKDEEGYCYSNNDGIMFSISNNKFTDINEYLSQNPITFIYPLAQESIKTVDLSDNHVYSYKDVTHYDCSSAEGSLVPTLSIDVPTNLSALVSRQRATIETLESENQILKSGQADLELGHEHQEEEIISTQDAVNFLLFDALNAASYRVGQKEYDRMAVYIANQIIRGKVSYQLAVSKYPQFLNDIDEILVNEVVEI